MSDPRAVFAYGTLQFDEVMEAVTGRRFSGVPATLAGYRRRQLVERSYPGVVPWPGERTTGLLYREVDAESLARLDVFESEIYDRLVLAVTTGSGERARAWTYVVAPRYRDQLSEKPWDPHVFLAEHGEAFIASCGRFRTEGVV